MYALAIHGGAGVAPKDCLKPSLEQTILVALKNCLGYGHRILHHSGSAIDAVTASVCALEDEPLFNAGRGSAFNSQGKQEMDAAIMSGIDRQAGAVANIFGPRNPIRVARAVLELSDHVLITGPNALRLANLANLPFEDEEYFFSLSRWRTLQEILAMKNMGNQTDDPYRRHGTVGAVALDVHGNIAAATSTGGMTGKLPGRIGDSPCIGAGTYADNTTCAVSATGYGEVFLQRTAASEVAARMRYAKEDIRTAADKVVIEDLASYGGSGGLIAVDRLGNIAMPYNCNGMYRASIRLGEDPFFGIYS